ncbi:MAG: thioredoxin domain-containing protein [Patescibacteria group bacterium]
MPQNLSVPIAIVVAGALIAGALFFAGRSATPQGDPSPVTGDIKNVPAVSEKDHILGNPDADIVIVEYSDIECPFCKQFHVTMQQIMNEYGGDGKVAWVYRHFPLSQLHPNAPALSEASECVAELGGNSAFWKFLDEVFALAPINTFFPMDQLTATAVKAGVSGSAFDTCVTSGKHRTLVETQFNDAIETGGQGTPHNIVITKAGQFIPLSGAQPYATVKNVIETILAENN